MGKYLVVSSRDALFSQDAAWSFELTLGLMRDGHEVTLFLVQDGVFVARRSLASNFLGLLVKDGVDVIADEFSLRERGIPQNRLVPGVKTGAIDVLVDQLAEGRKAIWH